MKGKKSVRKMGIHPVIATIILIAVSLMVGITLGGFAFGIFGTYSSAPTVSVKDAQLYSNGTLAITLHNSGSAKTFVTNVHGGNLDVYRVPGNSGWFGNTDELKGNSQDTVQARIPSGSIVRGGFYTFVVDLTGGLGLTISLTAVG